MIILSMLVFTMGGYAIGNFVSPKSRLHIWFISASCPLMMMMTMIMLFRMEGSIAVLLGCLPATLLSGVVIWWKLQKSWKNILRQRELHFHKSRISQFGNY